MLNLIVLKVVTVAKVTEFNWMVRMHWSILPPPPQPPPLTCGTDATPRTLVGIGVWNLRGPGSWCVKRSAEVAGARRASACERLRRRDSFPRAHMSGGAGADPPDMPTLAPAEHQQPGLGQLLHKQTRIQVQQLPLQSSGTKPYCITTVYLLLSDLIYSVSMKACANGIDKTFTRWWPKTIQLMDILQSCDF